MTFAEAYKQVNAQIADQRSLTLILGSRMPDQELSLQRVTLTQDLSEEFASIAKDAVLGSDEVTFLPYDASYKPDPNELMYISLEDQPEIKAVIDDLVAFQNIPLFKGDEAVTDNLKLYSVVVGSKKENRSVLLRATSQKIELSKGTRLAAILRAGTFSKLKQTVFLFDKKVDCVASGGFLFILSKGNFERLFQYYKELRAHAAETVDSVVKYVPISNVEEFRAACTSEVRFMDKLASISKRPYLSRVTMADIKRVVDDFKLSVPIVVQDGSEKLVFEHTADKRWQILKLLDDDYLGSVMTSEKYATNSKIRLSV